MDTSSLIARPFIFDIVSMMPTCRELLEPLGLQLSKSVASYMSGAYPSRLSGIEKVVLEASGVNSISKMFTDSHDKMVRGMFPSMNIIAELGFVDQMHSSIGAITKSLALSVDTSNINSILANAATFRERLAEENYDELTDEFFENHRDLTATLEKSPALFALSIPDRRLIVWFVGVIVTLYVGTALLHLATDFPEVKAMIDAFGLDAGGGLPAGLAAAKLTDKALDKLPQEESD
jgi:hypothetical protein